MRKGGITIGMGVKRRCMPIAQSPGCLYPRCNVSITANCSSGLCLLISAFYIMVKLCLYRITHLLTQHVKHDARTALLHGPVNTL